MICCEILPGYFFDHDCVDLVFDVKNVSSHGPGLWRLNIELLQDTEFCNLISRTISKHVKFQCCFPSVHKWWDFLKISFRDTALAFGKSKQTRLNRDKVTATNLLIKAKRDLPAGDISAKT